VTAGAIHWITFDSQLQRTCRPVLCFADSSHCRSSSGLALRIGDSKNNRRRDLTKRTRVRANGRDNHEGASFRESRQVGRHRYLAMICCFLVFVQACGTQLYFKQAECRRCDRDHQKHATQLIRVPGFREPSLLTLAIQVRCCPRWILQTMGS